MKGQVQLSQEDKNIIKESGVLIESPISADFFQQDNLSANFNSFVDGLEVMDIRIALKRFPELKNYYGKALSLTNKEYPLDTEGGYFIRVKKNENIELPIQACLFLKAQGFKQKVHNLIILEEGSSLNLITGCTASKSANESIHIGVSEFFIKKSAKVNFTMIHSWKEDISAKPITAAIIDENGSFASNYICLKRVKSVSMYPTSILKGKKASAFFNSIILAHQGSEFDIGSKVIFKEKNTSSEIITRVASLGGKITARGSLKAESEEIRGHLECQGLLLSENGIIKAIPELESNHKEVDLSHEASIGKIHKDEIEYLRSKGLSEKNAKSLIISGFLNPEIINAPESTIKVIKDLEEKMLEGSL